jgi:hypothetical protein
MDVGWLMNGPLTLQFEALETSPPIAQLDLVVIESSQGVAELQPDCVACRHAMLESLVQSCGL